MKTSNFYWNQKRQKVEIWHEEVNGMIYYWEKIEGISYTLTKRQYDNRLKKIKEIKSRYNEKN